MRLFPYLFTLQTLLGGLNVTSASEVPTDNPIATFYGADTYSWTHEIHWNRVFNVADFGAIPDDGQDDLAAINAAMQAAHEAGGGVVYFPAGVWDISDDLVMRSGVVLRGASPAVPTTAPNHARGDGTHLAAPAQLEGYLPPSRLQFPRYIPSFTGAGTPNETAFKVITVEDEVTTSNWGLVNLDLDHVRIRNYQDTWLSGPFELADRATVFNPEHDARNIVIFGNRGNHMAAPDPRVPSGSQHAWQRFSARGSANIALMAYENILVANNRLNDNITDDWEMPGYLLSNGALPNKSAGREVSFGYTNVYGINLNRVYANPSPPPSSLTPDTFPEVFRKGMVVRDNWIYLTARVAYHVTGQDAVIVDNVKVDDPNKFSIVLPVGTRQTAGSDTNENRGVDFSGFNVTVSGNDLDVHSHFAISLIKR
ncbi:MAG: glycoside hydrolase family 55 protein [Verrucomicrobia bacterium]|nr:glycoside hydrolase family 55 protein [Verrucomicrobiota bacterium]